MSCRVLSRAMGIVIVVIVVATVAAVVGCESKAERPTAPAPAVAAAASAQAALGALDALDGRTPVPLLPMMANHQKQNMRDHLVAVQEIVSAIGAKDFDAMQKAAARIGYSEQMGQMCSHMGAGARGFTDQALAFHRTADTIGEAAKKHDMEAALKGLSETLATCTACHAAFKQRLVDEATWAAATKMPPPTHAH